MATEFQNLKAAEAAFAATESLDDCTALEVAERAYFAKLAAMRAAFAAIPEGDRKCSAETNADDTKAEGGIEDGDEIEWFRVAIASFDFAE